MKRQQSRVSIRGQLLALFGLVLVTGGIVLAIDEIDRRTTLADLDRIRNESIVGLRATKSLSDRYGLDVPGVVFKVRNYLMSWETALATLDASRARAERDWTLLLASGLSGEQQVLVDEIRELKHGADRATERLRQVLLARDIEALGVFADTALFPAIDPVTAKLKVLADYKQLSAEAQAAVHIDRVARIGALRIGLSVATLLVVLVVGRTILRNIYRGVESLVFLAQRAREHDFDAMPGYTPRGELGEVMQAFVDSRRELKEFEAQALESEARAMEANRAKGAFLASMSHEIRTPMIGVTGMLEVLEHTNLDQEQRNALAVMQSSAQSLLTIINDILDFSKIEAGKLEIEPTDIDLRKLVAHVAQNYLGVASSKGLKLTYKVDPRVAAAHRADPVRLRQILSNFLSNAVKFTDQGEVELSVERFGTDTGSERLAFRVRDTGIGISPENQQKLFAPFTQAESGTTRQYGGTGLGLAICRRLADLMGGEVTLSSRAGHGTTLSLLVPLPIGDPAGVAIQREKERAQSFPRRPVPSREDAIAEGSLILLADDHPTNRAVLVRQLALAGFRCETADDGEHALARWQEGVYALVLSDIHMPKLDGFGFVTRLREAERQRGLIRTPVLAISANVMRGEAERCFASGMDDFIAKPVSTTTLSTRIRQWLPHVRFTGGELPAAEPAAHAPERAAPVPPPLDRAALAELATDPESERELVREFCEAARHDLDAIAEARRANDLPAVTREAHRLKGASKLVGATELAEIAAAIEAAGRATDWDAVAAKLPGLSPALARIEHWAGAAASDRAVSG
jgi:signal transduction histidine kinase/CheY-like chemotaxis protein/HPt (histidine-containing phosphotransfer) domain-containing protein